MTRSPTISGPSSRFTPLALWFGALSLLVPGYGFFNATNLSQQEFMATQTEENRVSWTQSEASDIDPDLALSLANTCRVAGADVNGERVAATTVFDRNFNFNEEEAAFHEGHFFCGLDGSVIQIVQGRPKAPLQVAPEDMDSFHQILMDRHRVPVDQILKFKLENSQGDAQND